MAKLELDVTKLVNEAFYKAKPEIIKMCYTKRIYEIIKNETAGLDSVYEDFIQHCVGIYGLNALLNAKVLESCGVINGRRLYTLLDLKGDN